MPMRVVPTAYHRRILDAAHHAGSPMGAHHELITAIPAAEPNRLSAVLHTMSPAQVIVTGTLDRRLLLLQHPGDGHWTVADLSGQPHQTRAWPTWARPAIHLNTPKAG
jgi:hypothetical protein